MKKAGLLLLGIFLTACLFGQDTASLIKLQEYSYKLGIKKDLIRDTSEFLVKKEIIGSRAAQRNLYLLRAAESYYIEDYENSFYYIRKVKARFYDIDFNNIRFLILIGNFANLKDIKNTAGYYYFIHETDIIEPVVRRIIQGEIRKNFRRTDFDHALSTYYYYHKRQRILDEINFNK